MNMLLTTIVLFIAFGVFAVVIVRLLVKAFPASAEDVKALHERHKKGMFDDDKWSENRSGGMNISNSIDISNWN